MAMRSAQPLSASRPSSASAMPSETSIDISNWRAAGIPPGLSRSENVRLAPGCASHVFPRCPRPAVCSRVATTKPCGASGIAASSVLVEPQLSSHRGSGVIIR